MKLKKKKRPYWTYWFLVWRQTHLPEGRWLGTGTGSGLCVWRWTTSVSGSPQSRYQSVTQWTCRLWDRKQKQAQHFNKHLMYSLQSKTNKQEQPPLWQQYTPVVSLPTVSMVSLSSMRSCALGMSMCMRSVCCCLLIGSAGRVFLLRSTKQKRTSLSQAPVIMNSPVTTMQCAYWDEVAEHSYLMSISAKLFASAKQTENVR